MTTAEFIAQVRHECHEERNRIGEATPLQLAALGLAARTEQLVEQALSLERELHNLIKDRE